MAALAAPADMVGAKTLALHHAEARSERQILSLRYTAPHRSRRRFTPEHPASGLQCPAPVRPSAALACHACSASQPDGSPQAPTSLARGDRPARACRPLGTDALQRRNPETENHMDLQLLIAQWSGRLPEGFVPHTVMREQPPRCSQPRCTRSASRKADGSYWKSCDPCRSRRAKSCKRRRAALVAEGGGRRK